MRITQEVKDLPARSNGTLAVFSYIVEDLPGNGEVAVVRGLKKMYGVSGVAKEALMKRYWDLSKRGYTYALCTVRNDNTVQKHIMDSYNEKRSWPKITKLAEFYTDSAFSTPICLYGIDLAPLD